ncbi:MAG: hypothetical protein WB820_15570, partial [Rhodoplanes sp.]
RAVVSPLCRCPRQLWTGIHPISPSSNDRQAQRLLWDGFAATTPAEMMLNLFSFSALTAQEKETPLLGVNAPIFSLKSIVLRKPRNSR